MRHRLAVLAAALVLAHAAPSRADPAVTGIALGSIPFVLWALFADPPQQRDPDLLVAAPGWFDGLDHEAEATSFRLEYRSGYLLWKVRPQIGLVGTTDGGAYGYAGLRLDAYFGRRIVISPSFSAVGYYKGEGKDLGSPAVARSGFDVSYRFDNGNRLGFGFHHMSHGKLFGDKNPGTEIISLTYALPVERLFGH